MHVIGVKIDTIVPALHSRRVENEKKTVITVLSFFPLAAAHQQDEHINSLHNYDENVWWMPR